METIDEAVSTYRLLAEANPAAFLPNLAASLNDRSIRRSALGDRAGALEAIDEAVGAYRRLAEANPAAFLPNLSLSLNNQSNRRADIGDRAGALAAIDEAVSTYRRLAEANPAAFLPDLAMSLNNQSIRRAEVGDRAGALEAINEAVNIRRRLAEANPAAVLPDLAGSLNNQCGRRAEVGDRAGALEAIDEAVGAYRRLAEANPAAFLPDLAASLNNLSGQRSEHGNQAGAMEAIDEAVNIRRRLAEINPAAFLPDLAGSLKNQCVQRAEVGDRAGALEAIDEAVGAYRRLAEANPAVFLPDLASALAQLGRLRLDANPHREAAAVWAAALDDQTLPIYRGELQAHLAAWQSKNNYGDPAVAALHQALTLVSADTDAAPAFAVSRARQTAREVALTFDTADTADFPRWATAPIPDGDLIFINKWAGATTWSERETVTRAYGRTFPGPTMADTVDTLNFLHPGEPTLEAIRGLLAAVHEHGLAAVLDQARANDALQTLVSEWIATPTWPKSFTYLTNHHEELCIESVAAFLNSLDTSVARQHLAILGLSSDRPLPALFEIVTDPAIATDHALDALEHAQTDHLQLIVTANPAILELPSTGPLLLAVLALAAGDNDTATQAAATVGGSSSPIQRRAHLVRLRAWASQAADLPGGPEGVAAVIAAFETAAENEASIDTSSSDHAPADDSPDDDEE